MGELAKGNSYKMGHRAKRGIIACWVSVLKRGFHSFSALRAAKKPRRALAGFNNFRARAFMRNSNEPRNFVLIWNRKILNLRLIGDANAY